VSLDPLLTKLFTGTAAKKTSLKNPYPRLNPRNRQDRQIGTVSTITAAAKQAVVDMVSIAASVNTQIRTIHSSQPVSSIREVLQNTTVPNRFRIKARVETIPGIGKPSKIMVKWCIPCERR
jgi:hypothetical protein